MKKFLTAVIPCVAVITAALLFPTTAKAFLGMSGNGANGTVEAPTEAHHAIFDEETFKNGTKEFHMVPFGDINLEFEIMLPKDWQTHPSANIEQPDLTKKIVVQIAKFGNPPGEAVRTYVTVEAQQLDREIDARSWLKHFILSRGFAPDGEVVAQDIKRASGSYVHVTETTSTHAYIAVQFSGNLAVITRFEIPLIYKDHMAFLQKRAVDSFKMAYEKEGNIENVGAFTLVDALKFSYPTSWVISNQDFKDLNFLSVQLHNRSITNVIEGFIRFYAVRRTDENNFLDETTAVRKYYTDEMNVDFKKMLSSEKLTDFERFPFVQKEVYNVGFSKGNRQDQEFTLMALANSQWYFYIVMISPLENNDLDTWAHNKRSFDLIVRSMISL